jgi:capsule polysaccharide export protein KpsE/RkpR
VPETPGQQEKYVKYKIHYPKIKLPKFNNWPKEINFDMENIFTNMSLFKLIVKWRLSLTILLALSVAFSILFSCSWFIKPRYKSTAILYPSNLIPYSSETPTELMLQIFRSDDIKDSLISKFDLASHYNIDQTDDHFLTKVIKELESNIDVRKTEYESVVIEILDTKAEIASNMVKEMVNLFNKKARRMQREKSQEVLKIAESQLEKKQIQIDTLQKKLDSLRMVYGILDYKIQTKETMKAYYKMLGGGGKANLGSINGTIENLKEKGGEYLLLDDMFSAATKAYSELKKDYETALRDVTKELTYSNYVSSPVPADKKTYPIRWLIVLISFVSTFIFAMMIIMIVENIRNKKKVEIGNQQPVTSNQ